MGDHLKDNQPIVDAWVQLKDTPEVQRMKDKLATMQPGETAIACETHRAALLAIIHAHEIDGAQMAILDEIDECPNCQIIAALLSDRPEDFLLK